MSKVSAMLEILDRECQEMKMSLLADICDLCHYPFSVNQEELEEHCSACTISQDLDKLLEKQRTVTSGKVMRIVAEEMHPEGKEKDNEQRLDTGRDSGRFESHEGRGGNEL